MKDSLGVINPQGVSIKCVQFLNVIIEISCLKSLLSFLAGLNYLLLLFLDLIVTKYLLFIIEQDTYCLLRN